MILEKSIFRPSSTFPVTPLDLLLLQEEDLFLLQEEDLLLVQEEDLLLAQEEDLLLAEEKDLLLAEEADREGSPEKLKMVEKYFFPESSGDLWDQFR